ncbi:holin-like protein [Allopseudospirillum japonicum]|uniref:Holin-like protein n=1 Tax=Allopseudospirillum japonicum TaxID=64971 RepID=A0A1H6Q4F3_9GAMM|nr:CidA/LrgA family protein [Allopseudospirillum japonicum]SEI38698.1 holin-like protein [Allopseudospirillum japonicum]
MLIGLLVLLACQLLGELIGRALALPVPSPVLGMLLLLIALIFYGKVPDGVRQASEGILSYLALLFVPAGVGLMVHYPLIAADWWVIAIALVVSTGITLAVTAWVLNKLHQGGANHE